MKIRTKITILYTWLTFLVLSGSFAFVYVLMLRHTEATFYDQLWRRAMVTAQYNFEEDEMTPSVYRGVVESYNSKLNGEANIIINVADGYGIDSLKGIIPNSADVKTLLRGRTIEFRQSDSQAVGLYYSDNEGDFLVIVSAYDKQGADSARNLMRVLLIILVSSTVLVYLIGLAYAKNILAPVVKIINNVKTITASNLKTDLYEARGNDELSELSRTFNDMIHRLRDAFDMQNSFIRNASHELRNPLTAIMGEAEITLSRERKPEEYIASLQTISEESERLNSMMQGLLTLAQTGYDYSRIMKEHVDIRELILHTVKGLHNPWVNISVDYEKEYYVKGVKALLEVMFVNLIGNAVKFSAGKPVDITIGRKEGKVFVEIIDQGIGIPQNELKRIYQPFYRAANTLGYKGTGIGLALAYKVIDLHKGKIVINSEQGKGTNVTVFFYDQP